MNLKGSNPMTWQSRAAELARTISYPASPWYRPLSRVPRHLLTPRWFTSGADGWTVTDGQDDQEAWQAAAYTNTTIVTRAGAVHADQAKPNEPVMGRPTSSSTHPSLVIKMFEHGRVDDGMRLLDVATGSGYSAALATQRLGGELVTSVDVDPYLTETAAERLASIGLHPQILTCDATGPLPGEYYDAIVSGVGMPSIPRSWLGALRPGSGRLVTVLADTGLIITATSTTEGGAVGQVEWDRAAFMPTRTAEDYPPALGELFDAIRERDGDDVTASPYPVISVMAAWDVWSMLTLTTPGIEHRMQLGDDGSRTAWMLHADGSWARATTAPDGAGATVHQGGPRRLWDELDSIRRRWLHEGELPVYGAHVSITPEGVTTLRRGSWSVTV